MTPYDLPDYHALIRGIREIDRAGGDSTVARLVTADWLDEHGEWQKAAIIRMFAEHRPDSLMRVFGNDGTAVYFGEQLGLPVQALSDHYLVGFGRPKSVTVSSNGLVDQVECPLAWWLAHGPDLCRRHPVREVVITDASTEMYSEAILVNDRAAMEMVVNGESVTTQADRYYLTLYRQLMGSFSDSSEWFRNTTGLVAIAWAEAEADRPA